MEGDGGKIMGGKSRKTSKVNKKLLDRIANIKKNKFGRKVKRWKSIEYNETDSFAL